MKDFRHEMHTMRSVLKIITTTTIVLPPVQYLLHAEHFAIVKNNSNRSYCVGTTYQITMALGARPGDRHLPA